MARRRLDHQERTRLAGGTVWQAGISAAPYASSVWDTSDWIAVGALVVATISAVLTIIRRQDDRQARPDPLRAAVFEQQTRLTSQLVELVRASHLVLVDLESTDADHFAANERMVEFVRTAVFLPPAVVEAARLWLTETSDALRTNADLFAAATRADGQPHDAANPTGLHDQMDEAFAGSPNG